MQKTQFCSRFHNMLQITAERRQWEKFGLAATAGNQGVTGQHGDQIMFERTNLPKKEEKKDAASAAKVHMVCFHYHARSETTWSMQALNSCCTMDGSHSATCSCTSL